MPRASLHTELAVGSFILGLKSTHTFPAVHPFIRCSRKMPSMTQLCLDQPFTITPAPVTYTLICGIPIMEKAVHELCEDYGFIAEPSANITVLLDLPYGSALRTMQRLDQTTQRLIVVTWNVCSEYLEDVWDLTPTILLANANLEEELPTALVRAAQGERYRHIPPRSTSLSLPERSLLQALARGWCNKQIAEHLMLQEKTVRNMLTSVYEKLDVENRTQATLYYWGRADLLG